MKTNMQEYYSAMRNKKIFAICENMDEIWEHLLKKMWHTTPKFLYYFIYKIKKKKKKLNEQRD